MEGVKVKSEITTISQKWIDIVKPPLDHDEWNSFNNYLARIVENLDKEKTAY